MLVSRKPFYSSVSSNCIVPVLRFDGVSGVRPIATADGLVKMLLYRSADRHGKIARFMDWTRCDMASAKEYKMRRMNYAQDIPKKKDLKKVTIDASSD